MFNAEGPGGDTDGLRSAYFTPTKRNLFGAPEDKRAGESGMEGYGTSGDGTWVLTKLAWASDASVLSQHQNELQFLLGELDRLREVNVTNQNWQEFYDSWAALDGLYETFRSSTAKGAITHLFAGTQDETAGPRHALGMAKQL